jgi:hypothetical protein
MAGNLEDLSNFATFAIGDEGIGQKPQGNLMRTNSPQDAVLLEPTAEKSWLLV